METPLRALSCWRLGNTLAFSYAGCGERVTDLHNKFLRRLGITLHDTQIIAVISWRVIDLHDIQLSPLSFEHERFVICR